MMSVEDIAGFDKLLESAKDLPDVKLPDPTFLQISGRPHHEVVLANFLRFFLDPNSPHGLGCLFADALFASVDGEEPPKSILDVQTEVRTSLGGRIDIVILEPDRVTKIELKVYAPLHNNLIDYSSFRSPEWGLVRDGGRSVHEVKLILAPAFWFERKALLFEGGFLPYDLPVFVENIESRLDEHAESANPAYWQLMLDLLRTIKDYDLRPPMNVKLAELIAKESEFVHKFLQDVSDLSESFRKAVPGVARQLTEAGFGPTDWMSSVRSAPHIWIGASATSDFYTMTGEKVRAGIVLEPHGWSAEMQPEKGRIDPDSRDALLRMIVQSGVADAWEETNGIGYRRNRLSSATDAVEQDVVNSALAAFKPFGLTPVAP